MQNNQLVETKRLHLKATERRPGMGESIRSWELSTRSIAEPVSVVVQPCGRHVNKINKLPRLDWPLLAQDTVLRRWCRPEIVS